MHRIKRNYSIKVTKDSGCFNVPHKFRLCVSEPTEVIKAIQLKGFERYTRNHWEILITENKIIIELGCKTIENLDEKLSIAREILEELLNLTTFEINVAKGLIKNES